MGGFLLNRWGFVGWKLDDLEIKSGGEKFESCRAEFESGGARFESRGAKFESGGARFKSRRNKFEIVPEFSMIGTN